MSAESRLKQAEHERAVALRAAKRETASLEALIQSRKRLVAIIGHLRQGQPTDAEKKLIPVLQQDVKGIAARIGVARKKRAEQETTLTRLRKLIARLKHRLAGGKLAMFDSVTVSEIPQDAKAAAGYTSGLFHTWPAIQAGPWPNKLSIAVTSSEDARCADVEAGDLTIADGVAWAKRRISQGHRPTLYTSLSNAAALITALANLGIGRGEFDLWTAHYDGHAHLCSPACGFGMPTTADATQWTDQSGGRNLDESLCDGSFF